MTTYDTIFLVVGAIFILYLTVELMTKDSWRALAGFALAMNIDMVVDILVKNLK